MITRKQVYWVAGAVAAIWVANKYLGLKFPFDIAGYLTGTSAVDANQNKYAGDTLGGFTASGSRPTMGVSQTGVAQPTPNWSGL
jgi:hypothetical protein